MTIIKAVVEIDKKRKNSVVARVFTGHMSGKIVFFNGSKPKVGENIILEKFQDKGRFLVCEQWKTHNQEEKRQMLIKVMSSRIKYNCSGIAFKHFIRALVDREGNAARAAGFYIQFPLNALDEGLKGDKELLSLFYSFYNEVCKNRDLISKAIIALLNEAKNVFEKGGGEKEIMKLKEFNDFYKWMQMLLEHPGSWPTFGIETEMGPNGRKFFPLE